MPDCHHHASSAVTVGLLGPADVRRWDAFVLRCPNATFFHRAGWQRVIERAFGHPTWFMYAEIDGRIEAVLPLAQIRSRLFGNGLHSLPFCVYGGIAAQRDDAAAALDHAAQTLAQRLQVDHLEYRHMQPQHADWRTSPIYFSFRKPLHATPELNLQEIPRKQRAMVRKGMAGGLRSVSDGDAERFFKAYASSVHRLGTPVFSPAYFRILQEVFGSHCEVLSVEHGGATICSVLLFYFRDQVLPYYGGGGEAARALAGNDFMYWEVMRRACERGCTLFDFGRSKLGTGSFDFKKNWGFTAQALHYETKLYRGSLPDKNPLNPRYQLFIKAWRRLPLAVANMIGPHIVRSLG